MIKGTNANCKIKNVTITGSIAKIDIVIYSNVQSLDAKAFQFYIKDASKYTLLSTVRYWIDRCNYYTNDSSNVDINMYKEISLMIDITNLNTSVMKANRWIRTCKIILRNTQNINENAWESETLQLISKEIELPSIKNLIINTQKTGELTFNWNYSYISQEDFNYNNNNLKTIINIYRASNSIKIESINVLNSVNIEASISAVSLNSYNYPVNIEILIMNLKDDVLYGMLKYYIPAYSKTITYVKTNNGVKKSIYISIKDTGTNLNTLSINTPKEPLPNFTIDGDNTIIITRSNSLYNKSYMIVYLNGEYSIQSLDNTIERNVSGVINVDGDVTFKIIFTSSFSKYSKNTTYTQKISFLKNVSDILVCSDTLSCDE